MGDAGQGDQGGQAAANAFAALIDNPGGTMVHWRRIFLEVAARRLGQLRADALRAYRELPDGMLNPVLMITTPPLVVVPGPPAPPPQLPAVPNEDDPYFGRMHFDPQLGPAGRNVERLKKALTDILAVDMGDVVVDRSKRFARCDFGVVPTGADPLLSRLPLTSFDVGANLSKSIQLCISDRRPCTWEAGKAANAGSSIAARLMNLSAHAESHYVFEFIDQLPDERPAGRRRPPANICEVVVRRLKSRAGAEAVKSEGILIQVPRAGAAAFNMVPGLSDLYAHMIMAQLTDRSLRHVGSSYAPTPKPIAATQDQLTGVRTALATRVSFPWYFSTVGNVGVNDSTARYSQLRLKSFAFDWRSEQLAVLYSRLDTMVLCMLHKMDKPMCVAYVEINNVWRGFVYEVESLDTKSAKPGRQGEDEVRSAVHSLTCRVFNCNKLRQLGGQTPFTGTEAGPGGSGPSGVRPPEEVAAMQTEEAEGRREGRSAAKAKAPMSDEEYLRRSRQRRSKSPLRQVRTGGETKDEMDVADDDGPTYECIEWTHPIARRANLDSVTVRLSMAYNSGNKATDVRIGEMGDAATSMYELGPTGCIRNPLAVRGGFGNPWTDDRENADDEEDEHDEHMQTGYWGSVPQDAWYGRMFYVNPVLSRMLKESMDGTTEGMQNPWNAESINQVFGAAGIVGRAALGPA